MPNITYKNVRFECRDGESVLDASLRRNMGLPFSCRSGTCQVCLQRCVSGSIPAEAQKGIRPGLRVLGYFLPCKCIPTGDMEMEPPRDADLYTEAVVHRKEMLSLDVCRLLLEPATTISYRSGQFVNLRRADGLARSYSLASVPQEDYHLELHVKRMPGGALSNWIFDTLQAGDEIEIQGPQGRSYYAASDKTQSILLVATGTGLAPMLGIARDALLGGHSGDIHLYHGSRHLHGLYLHERLLDLSAQYPNFRYNGCVSGSDHPPGVLQGRVHEVAFGLHEELRGWRVHLAGHADMVHAAETLALRAAARPADIFSDPFDLTDRRQAPRRKTGVSTGRRTEPPPDPELWKALEEGKLMRDILTDFYTRVFEDTRLSPYFRNVTRERLIDKVYSFMRQFITGDKTYFGDRPRNAHHWMVISDELFDYREAIMTDCLRRHGLPDHLIKRWNAYEESFRPDIVKPAAWPRVVGGVELPVDGFGVITLEVGSLCDGCQSEIQPGTRVRYHLRMGTTYCPACQAASD
jgi:ferredoxin-NADP reductase/ferredoxin/truncated hemoglobin YjbI